MDWGGGQIHLRCQWARLYQNPHNIFQLWMCKECVLRALVPNEMGKYNCFLLGNAFFIRSSRIYFIYVIYYAAAHVCMWKSHVIILCLNTDHGGGHGGST